MRGTVLNLFLNILWDVFQTCTKRLQELEGSLKRELLLKLVKKEYDLYSNNSVKGKDIQQI